MTKYIDIVRMANGLIYTGTLRDECRHLNGWYITVKFWIFSKRGFSCADCGEFIPNKSHLD